MAVTASPDHPQLNQSVTLRAVFSNVPSGSGSRYNWEIEDNGKWHSYSNRPTLNYLAAEPESWTFRVTVSYGSGAWATSDPLTVNWTEAPPNRAPVFNGESRQLDSALPGFLVSLPMWQSEFSDPNGEPLTFTLSASRDDVYAADGGFTYNDQVGQIFFLARTAYALASPDPSHGDAYYTVITMIASNPDCDTAQATATFRTNPAEFACPSFSSATADGATLTIAFDADLAPSFTAPKAGEFEVKADGAAVSVTDIGEVTVGDRQIVLTLGYPVYFGQTVTVSYTPGGSPVAAAFQARPVEVSAADLPGPPQNFDLSVTPGSQGQFATNEAKSQAGGLWPPRAWAASGNGRLFVGWDAPSASSTHVGSINGYMVQLRSQNGDGTWSGCPTR